MILGCGSSWWNFRRDLRLMRCSLPRTAFHSRMAGHMSITYYGSSFVSVRACCLALCKLYASYFKLDRLGFSHFGKMTH